MSPATLFTDTDTRLARPRMVPVDKLPRKAIVNRQRTPWQVIVNTLVAHEGQWFELTRRYTSLGSALHSARRVLEADYDTAIASRLESGSLDMGDGTFTCYLRIAAPVAEDDSEAAPEDDGA